MLVFDFNRITFRLASKFDGDTLNSSELTSYVRILEIFDDRLPSVSDKVEDCNARDPNPDKFFEPDSTRVANV